MKSLSDHLNQYAAYHRNPWNIATHFVGIPLIVAAVAVLLSRPGFAVGGISLSPATLVVAASLAFYFLLDLAFGAVMLVLLGLALRFGGWAAAQPTDVWLAIGAGGFTVGWAFQFVGHYLEGRKPAFMDDLTALPVGPLFIVAETLFLLGLREELRCDIEKGVGPVRPWQRTAR